MCLRGGLPDRLFDYLAREIFGFYDNQYLFNIIDGYRLNDKWEFSVRWGYANGVTYTPFDAEQSQSMGIGIIDQNRIYDARYPDYHSLNLRVDRRFFFQHSNIVDYLSLWNVYNRKSIAMYYWDEVDNRQEAYYP